MESIKKSVADLTEHFNLKMAEFQKDLKSAIPATSPTSNINHQFNSFRAFVLTALENLQLQVELLSRQNDEIEMRSRRKILLVHGVAEAYNTDAKSAHPQYLNEVGHRVCVTQPRVAAAVSLGVRVAQERGEEPGRTVGYAASMTSSRGEDTSIVFMTEGVLLREMFASPLLMQYSCIVLDEVHERTLLTDVLMGLLKKVAKKRRNLKLVVSSATMDAEFLRDFFDLADKKGPDRGRTSAIMSVQGRMHPIDVFYVEEPVPDYVKATVETVIKIHENEPFGDILAFLTSQEEILSALEPLREYAEKNNTDNKTRRQFPSGVGSADMVVLPMYGSLPHYQQIKVFQTAGRNERKVVLATNIAETSITIPGVVYVIDCGFHKLPHFDPSVGVESVCVTSISKNNAAQRAGRAGRTSRGKCFRLYTESEYDKLAASVPPEMCRSDLSGMLLQLKALGIHNLLRFTFPTAPPAKCLLAGLESLYALGALASDGNLTPKGAKLAEMPLKPTVAAMLYNSAEYGCIEEMLSIAAMMHVDGVFRKPSGGREGQRSRIARRNNFEVAEGDIIMYLNVYDAYSKTKSRDKKSSKACKDWCQRLYINHRVMEKACEIRRSLEKLIKGNFEMTDKVFDEPDLGTGKCRRVMRCVSSGLFGQAARRTGAGEYSHLRGASLGVAPDSCLHDAPQPPWVVFAAVQSSGDKTYMRELMAVEKEWLLEVAPHYYREA
ncbi:unnamed protein product, partial [Iphiclides podalirius]